MRYIGHSNLAGWQIAEAHYVAAERAGIPFVSAQNHYSLLARAAEREVLPAVRALRPRASSPSSRCTTGC